MDVSLQAKFLTLAYAIRGGLTVDTNLRDLAGQHYYLDDLVDNNMSLRLDFHEDSW
jgi:hypothetical protein